MDTDANYKNRKKRKLIIGLSGASGVIVGIRLLQYLKKRDEIETHLIISDGAAVTIPIETEYNIDDIKKLADRHYDYKNLSACIASGSFRTEGMIIVPCSVKTASGIANGYADNLLQRAADVVIKERRKLILAVRESPLSLIHLKNLTVLSEAGAFIMPPVPAFYAAPKTVNNIIEQFIGKMLDKFDIEYENYKQWGRDALCK